jgi:GGDEF domain-containing protein
MRKSERLDPQRIEQTEKHLWILTLTIIVILAVGLGLMMYPTVFSSELDISGSDMRKYFFSFCVLALLTVSYLLDRQFVIRQLRRRLREEHQQVITIRHEASTDLLATLPGIDHFRDRLAMEFRRSSHTSLPLSLLIVSLRPSGSLAQTFEVETAFGDAAKALTRRLRAEDSLYLFRPGVFAIVLPNVDTTNAQLVSARLTDGLQDAAGASLRFSSEVRVFNYPEHAATAREMEQAVQPYFLLSHSNPARTQ